MDFKIDYYADRERTILNPTGLFFVAFHWVEVNTEVVENAWVRGNADLGTASATIFFDQTNGLGVTNTGKVWLGVKEGRDFWPDGGILKAAPKCRQIRIEGQRESARTLLSFGIVLKAKA